MISDREPRIVSGKAKRRRKSGIDYTAGALETKSITFVWETPGFSENMRGRASHTPASIPIGSESFVLDLFSDDHIKQVMRVSHREQRYAMVMLAC